MLLSIDKKQEVWGSKQDVKASVYTADDSVLSL